MNYKKENCLVNEKIKVKCENDFRVFLENEIYYMFLIGPDIWVLDDEKDLIKIHHLDFKNNFKIIN